MTISELDPRLTFESFVVGPANRLASAAARRAADSPGTSYNPLFLYSYSGLGKTHILMAIAHRAKKINPDLQITYLALERQIEELAEAGVNESEDLNLDRLKSTDVLLVDDVQFLSGNQAAQDTLLQVLDQLNTSGSQVVLASDRPPSEIDGMDSRIVSRFSGGLIVDIAPPEYETRVAIVRKKLAERGGEFEEGAAELIARFPIRNVRELGGVINRLLAIQELEGRRVQPAEIPSLIANLNLGEGDEFGSFIDELAQDVATTVELSEAPWRRDLRESLEEAEREGFNTRRLRSYLEHEASSNDARRVGEQFRNEIERLRVIRQELNDLGNPWPEAALGVLRDPDRMEEAESLLASARELTRPFPELLDGPSLDQLTDVFTGTAAKSAQRILEPDGGSYNPLFLWSPAGVGAEALMNGVAHSFRERSSKGRVACISVKSFADDFIRALSAGVAGAWRERWWRVELLLVHRVQDLSSTERAQDELFHLLEAVKRNGGRVVFSADRPPAKVGGIDARLRGRFEGGVVVEVETDDLPMLDNLLSLPEDLGEASGEGARFDPVMGANVLEMDHLDDLNGILATEVAEESTAEPEAGPTVEPAAEPAAGANSSATTNGELNLDEAVLGLRDASSDGLDVSHPEEVFDTDGLAAVVSGTANRVMGVGPSGGASVHRSQKKLSAGWAPTNEDVVWDWPVVEDLVVWEGAE